MSLTDSEVSVIDRAVARVGGGALLRAELIMWSCCVVDNGTAHERDVLAMFMRGELRPIATLDDDGCPVFVPAAQVPDVACRESAACILDDGHDGPHRLELGREVR